ncbi:uncharacterized protein LOC128883059 [Hylaeus volcanicus]|uniref:uncharacterized protein LOC128883059 n=1 Tax=Hylaeus volcanicus TaxID=313075 RepID=UPI0023B7A420|nr:uncharacterized protein LOC128883059 [Hylaeus volcanicus]
MDNITNSFRDRNVKIPASENEKQLVENCTTKKINESTSLEAATLLYEKSIDRKRELKEERRKLRDMRKRTKHDSTVTAATKTANSKKTYRLNSIWNFNCFKYVKSPNSTLTSHNNLHGSGFDPNTITLLLAADVERSAPPQGVMDFTESMVLKKDYALRPLTVCPTGRVFLDTMNPFQKSASDFLVTIAEPISRPEHMHEFQITIFSLYAGIGMGITVDTLLTTLNNFSKNYIPPNLKNLLYTHGNAFGRVKLVLRDNRYFLESENREDLEVLLSHPVISEARIRHSMVIRQQIQGVPLLKKNFEPNEPFQQEKSSLDDGHILQRPAPHYDSTILDFNARPNGESEGEKATSMTQHQNATHSIKEVFLFEVKSEMAGRVKECAMNDLKRPVLTEYDFRRDDKNPSFQATLRTTTKIRYYQERSLRKMFSNGRARSGIIVLPCGAGKTLTAITAATTIRKSCMVLTSSSVAVDQWKRSFVEFTTIDPSLVITLTSEKKQNLPEGAVVIISTYTMLAYSGKRSIAAAQIIQDIQSREWGLLIFDEVQFAPAPAFRKINDIVKSHCKLGLTATLVREDDLIHDLQWLIGPKLYESNWLELQESGYLAKVQVSEVWCTMTAEFYREYLRAPAAKQRKLWVCNPNKLRVCEYLLRFHEARNDKIIVFSDNLFALKEVACTLKKPFISGQVGMQERMIILNKFKNTSQLNTIFLSKVGDNAIDIPCANVVVQIAFNFASRRQEAQRLGRILRPKKRTNDTFNAFFYSLVSKDTQEMLYADKRQQFIIDQGYSYKVLPLSSFPMEKETLLYDDIHRQQEMLAHIMSTSDQCMDIELDEDVILTDSQMDMSKNIQKSQDSNNVIETIQTVLSNISNPTSFSSMTT